MAASRVGVLDSTTSGVANMTKEELADALDLLAVGVSGKAYDDLREAARRLRESEGERIEGWVAPDIGGHGHDSIFRKWEDTELIDRGLLVPASLILHGQEKQK